MLGRRRAYEIVGGLSRDVPQPASSATHQTGKLHKPPGAPLTPTEAARAGDHGRVAPLVCKTDKIDARVLAELSFRDLVPAIWLPVSELRAERERSRWRLHI